MNSKKLFRSEKLNIIIDSDTFTNPTYTDSKIVKSILTYYLSQDIELLRTEKTVSNDSLNNVTEIKLSYEESLIKSIQIEKEGFNGYKSTTRFGYRTEDIERIAKVVFNKESIETSEFNRLLNIFVLAAMRHRDELFIFITEDEVLLNKRLWLESHFPGGELNIFSLSESSLFIDLYLKNNKQFLINSGYGLNKGYWYWLSFRAKVPHFNVDDEIISALSTRFQYLLMSIDEIGLQYYCGVNNDTIDNMLYHFNYGISLITGIFDSLAIKTNLSLSLGFSNGPKISLSNNTGRDFLKKIRDSRQDIRDHIHSEVEFINLIYSFRELVIHRDCLQSLTYQDENDEGPWKANFIKLESSVAINIRTVFGSLTNLDTFEETGLYEAHGEFFLEPYAFIRKCGEKLTSFVDKYLELLGYPIFIDSLPETDDFKKTYTIFNEYHLGF